MQADLAKLPVPQRYDNPARPALIGALTVAAFLALFAAWGFLAPVSGAAIASGNLQVETQRQSVQHPYGGVVRELLVREGQHVSKGQTLLTLIDTDPRAKMDVLISERDGLLAQNARLIAERDEADSLQFDAALTSRQTDPGVAQAIANEIAVMKARRNAYEAELGILKAKMQQSHEQVTGLTAQADGLKRQRDLIEEEAQGARSLLEKGFTPKTRVLALERSEAQLDADRGARLAERSAAEQAIDEARLTIAKLGRSRIGEITDQLRKTQSRLAELAPQIEAAQDVLARTRITAPASGAVVGLTVFTEGGVIQPGARVLDVIRDDDPLIVESKLQLMDVNEVKPGANADVRLTGVPRHERPQLRGKVMTVSADKLTDERSGKGYYSLRVSLDPQDVARSSVAMQAGMPAEAIVTTRPRTLVDYVFGPLIDEVSGAFREK